MFSAVRAYVVARLADTPLRVDPFPHICVENVFPQGFYEDMLSHLPGDDGYARLVDTGRVSKGYSPERLCYFGRPADVAHDAGRAFWTGLFQALVHDEFTRAMLAKFQAPITERLERLGWARGTRVEFRSEAFLMRDLANYELGPHTDAPSKLISALFYLPADDASPQLGTALYVPKQAGFTCEGAQHHDFELFNRVTTLPYRRNVLVAFPKTPACFHGVERVGQTGARRDLLLFNVKGKLAAEAGRPAA